ncbi:MAG: hypothetical protein ABR608_03065 [Pseudonocardiaceae bacterium]
MTEQTAAELHAHSAGAARQARAVLDRQGPTTGGTSDATGQLVVSSTHHRRAFSRASASVISSLSR